MAFEIDSPADYEVQIKVIGVAAAVEIQSTV